MWEMNQVPRNPPAVRGMPPAAIIKIFIFLWKYTSNKWKKINPPFVPLHIKLSGNRNKVAKTIKTQVTFFIMRKILRMCFLIEYRTGFYMTEH